MNGQDDLANLMAFSMTRTSRVVTEEARPSSQATVWPIVLLVARSVPTGMLDVAQVSWSNAFGDLYIPAGSEDMSSNLCCFSELLNGSDSLLMLCAMLGYMVLLFCEQKSRPSARVSKTSAHEEDLVLLSPHRPHDGPKGEDEVADLLQQKEEQWAAEIAQVVREKDHEMVRLSQQKDEYWSGEISRLLREKEELEHLLQQKDEQRAAAVHQSVALQAHLEKAEEHLASQGAELEQARLAMAALEVDLEKAEKKTAEIKEACDMEVEALEVMLEKAKDQAGQIIKQAKQHGCPLDVADGLSSKFAKDALNGKVSKRQSSILVHYQGNLSNPVGALVYEHDREEEYTKIIAAFAVPKRGFTAMSIRALTESARRQGSDRLVLDAVRGAVPFWEHVGFVPDQHDQDEQEICVPMTMPLDSLSAGDAS